MARFEHEFYSSTGFGALRFIMKQVAQELHGSCRNCVSKSDRIEISHRFYSKTTISSHGPC